MRFFTPPPRSPQGWSTDNIGRRKRLYDQQKTPYQRGLVESQIPSRLQHQQLTSYKQSLDPVTMAKQIDQIQQRLIRLATFKTRALGDQIQTASAPPDPAGTRRHKGAS